MSADVLILHGWQNRRPDGHWQRWLAAELEATGARVRYPQLPDPDEPVLEDWITALEQQLDGVDPGGLTVVAHSLGCLLWLAHATRRADRGEMSTLARRVILVAPAAPDVLRGIPEIAAFAPDLEEPATRAALAASALERVTIVAGTDDPYCPEGAQVTYAQPLDADLVSVEGGGHLTIDDGYGPFPLVLDLATR